MGYKAYVNVNLLSLFSLRNYNFTCKKCLKNANYILIKITNHGDGTGLEYIHYKNSTYCSEHLKPVLKRTKLNVYDELEPIVELRNELFKMKQREEERIRQQIKEYERQQLEESGKILRMSGRKGRVYEMPDGTLKCFMHDGPIIDPCCWLEGSRIIDNRHRGNSSFGHSENCKYYIKLEDMQ